MKYELIYIPKFNWYSIKYGDKRSGGVQINNSSDIYKLFDRYSAGILKLELCMIFKLLLRLI